MHECVFDAHWDDPGFGHRFLADQARGNGEAMLDRAAWPIAASDGLFSVFGTPRRRTRLAGLVHQCTTISVL